MSTTVSYKGNTIATINNQTKTLLTAGTWVEGNITITDTSSGASVTITDETNSAGITCVITTGQTPTPTPTPTPSLTYETIFNGITTISESSGGNYLWLSDFVEITNGSQWRITWNGTENVHIASEQQYNNNITRITIGDASLTDFPYAFFYNGSDAWICSCGTLTGNVQLKIERAVEQTA